MKQSKIQGLAFIAPFKYLKQAYEYSDFSMVLTHLVQQNSSYADFYRNSEKPKLLDNSMFELKRCLSKEEVLEAAERVKADCVVLTDGKLDDLDFFKSRGYEVMFVPLTFEDFLEVYSGKAGYSAIDKIGVSCFSSQKLIGAEAFEPVRTELLMKVREQVKSTYAFASKTHFLGATHSNLKDLKHAVDEKVIGSMDTSLPIWSGLHDRVVDEHSPRVETDCDFNTELPWNAKCDENMVSYQQCMRYGHLQRSWKF